MNCFKVLQICLQSASHSVPTNDLANRLVEAKKGY